MIRTRLEFYAAQNELCPVTPPKHTLKQFASCFEFRGMFVSACLFFVTQTQSIMIKLTINEGTPKTFLTRTASF